MEFKINFNKLQETSLTMKVMIAEYLSKEISCVHSKIMQQLFYLKKSVSNAIKFSSKSLYNCARSSAG